MHDDDLHARPEQTGHWCEKPAGLRSQEKEGRAARPGSWLASNQVACATPCLIGNTARQLTVRSRSAASLHETGCARLCR